ANDACPAGPGRGTPQEWNSGTARCGLSARQPGRDVCAVVRSDLTGRRRDLVAGDEVALDVLAASARRIVNVESCEGDDGLTRRRGLFDHRHQYINVGWHLGVDGSLYARLDPDRIPDAQPGRIA